MASQVPPRQFSDRLVVREPRSRRAVREERVRRLIAAPCAATDDPFELGVQRQQRETDTFERKPRTRQLGCELWTCAMLAIGEGSLDDLRPAAPRVAI
jgi:hypothetical protein